MNLQIKYLFLLFILFPYSDCIARSFNQADSLRNLLLHSSTDTFRARQHAELAWVFSSSSLDSSLHHANQALGLALKASDSALTAMSRNTLGMVYLRMGSYEEAKEQYLLAEKLSRQTRNLEILSASYNNLGLIAKAQGKYEESITYYLDGLRIDEELGNNYGKASKHGNLGRLYFLTGDYAQALHHDTVALNLFRSAHHMQGEAIAMNNIGLDFWRLKDFERAGIWFHKSLERNKELNNEREISRNLTNLAALHRHYGDYQRALALDREALALRRKVNDIYGIAESLISVGTDMAYLGRMDEAGKEFDESRSLAIRLGAPQLLVEIASARAEALEITGNYREAYVALQRYNALKDSIVNLENKRVINELQIRYETEKKDRKLAEQQIRIVEQEAQSDRQRTLIFWVFLTAGGVTLTLVLFLVLVQQRRRLLKTRLLEAEKDRKMQQMKALIEGQERERSRLARELHDGVNGSLGALKMLTEQRGDEHKRGEKLGVIASRIDEISHEVREISHNLIPATLSGSNITDVLENYLTSLQKYSETDLEFQVYGKAQVLDHSKATHLYRIIQELTTNVLKHAKASGCLVQLNWHNDRISLTVEDDGCGFDAYNLNNESPMAGIGLKSVLSRVEIMEGKAGIRSGAKEGTTVEIEIPLKNQVL